MNPQQPMSTQDLARVLGLTIKKDDVNKVATFLGELSAYTDEDQMNISFNSPSSTGKTFIPTEVAQLFPQEDVRKIGYCSPTAFFHDLGEYNKKTNTISLDLSRQIIIFLDQPHTLLLQHLRPLLSHDTKELVIKITDKQERGGLKTKTVIIRGFPAVIFCTAGLKLDEQEATRFLLLSPEIDQEKLRESVMQTITRESDKARYYYWLDEDADRQLLQKRILAIREAGIREVIIATPEVIRKRFMARYKPLKPRHMRDIKRLFALIKSFALLNLWWRERNGNTIFANNADIQEAFKVWNKISVSQELNISPYVYDLYRDVIVAAWNEKNIGTKTVVGLTRQEIGTKHYHVYGRMLDAIQLRMQILPLLETAGLITQEPDSNDRRRILIYPTSLLTKSDGAGNSEMEGGVTTNAAAKANPPLS